MRDLSLALPLGLGKRKSKILESGISTNLILLVIIAMLALSYLFMVNSLGTKGYEIRKMEQQLRSIESTQKNLQVEASDLESINHLQLEAQKLNFVPATNVTYLKDSDFALK